MSTELESAIRKIESRDPENLKDAAHNLERIILKDPESFTRTQDSFAHNVAGRIALQLEDLFAPECPEATTISVLRMIRGVCLLHRPSRGVLGNEQCQSIILFNGISHKCSAIQIAAINTLVAILVRHVEAIRLFEQLKGVKLVCDVFKQSRTETAVKLAILKFLFFYLIPETKFPYENRAVPRKTTQDKQRLLGKYLSNVDGLVREFEMNRPFGHSEIEW